MNNLQIQTDNIRCTDRNFNNESVKKTNLIKMKMHRNIKKIVD